VWINQDPAHIDARSAAAAAFLLEVAAARLESDWGRFSDLIEWTCVQLRTSGPPTEFERSWHAASHALAGRARNRTWMLGESARLPHQKPLEQPGSVPRWAQTMQRNQPQPPAHLTHALERFPDDPHFQLSRVVAWTWGRDGEPTRNVRARDEDDRRLPRRTPQLEAIVTLEPSSRMSASSPNFSTVSATTSATLAGASAATSAAACASTLVSSAITRSSKFVAVHNKPCAAPFQGFFCAVQHSVA